MTARVALIGATGHGGWHLRHIAALGEAVELVALCDVVDVPDAPPGVPLFRSYVDLLSEIQPEYVVVCTPPHTHLAIASAAARAGSDVLLEKPPVLDLGQHEELSTVLAETGRAVQVGFQALGSQALASLKRSIAAGSLGRLTGIGVRGSWSRPHEYFSRADWAGRRSLDGRPVLDGSLVNPFAHALMQTLAIADEPVSTVEVELYRAHEIETDDTACLRLGFVSGLTAVIAVTLCGEEFIAGDITVTGTDGAAVLEYPTDRLQLAGQTDLVKVPGRISLLTNLIEHRSDPSVALLAPLSATREFTALLAPILAAMPVPLDPSRYRVEPGRVVIGGINRAVTLAASQLQLFSAVFKETLV